jgi:hypothetical protein
LKFFCGLGFGYPAAHLREKPMKRIAIAFALGIGCGLLVLVAILFARRAPAPELPTAHGAPPSEEPVEAPPSVAPPASVAVAPAPVSAPASAAPASAAPVETHDRMPILPQEAVLAGIRRYQATGPAGQEAVALKALLPGPAIEKLGMPPETEVLAIDNRPVSDPAAFAELLKRPTGIPLGTGFTVRTPAGEVRYLHFILQPGT